MNTEQLKPIVESALLAAGESLNLERIRDLFAELPAEERPSTSTLRTVLTELATDCSARGIELKEIASGFCFQVKPELSTWIKRLWQTRPPRYTRALMETLAIIAYRQPITRGEIEQIRGVNVSTNIVKTLLDHEWIRVVGQREVPGRPSLYATTRQFLDHFNLKNLEELPILIDPQNLTDITGQLEDQALLAPIVAAAEEVELMSVEN